MKVNGRTTVDDNEDDDGIAGPVPPLSDEQVEVQDDQEGRFFGGGITNDTAEVLDFIDERDRDDLGVCWACQA